MTETPPAPKRAFRGLGSAIFITCLLAAFPLIVQNDAGFWEGDVVAHFFHWFFTTVRFWPSVAAIVGFAVLVGDRIEKGEEYKEDLYVYGAVAGLIGLVLAVLSFPPVWERVKAFFS